MKAAILTLGLLVILSVSNVFAQSVGVKDIPAGEDTTIHIQKGVRSENKFEVVTNSSEIEGEPAPLMADARKNWKTECKEWETKTKDNAKENKEDKIVSLDCGKRTCSSSNGETICRSQATSKIRVRVQ